MSPHDPAPAPRQLPAEDRLTRIVEAVADGILLVDEDQRITFANTAAERFIGRPRRVLTSRCWHELHWRDAPGSANPFDPREIDRRVLEQGEHLTGVAVALLREDGALLKFSAGFVPLTDGGKTTGMVVSLTDITDRVHAEEASARDRALLRALIQSIPDLIFYKDREGRYLGCNRTFEDYAGVREEDLLGHTTAEVFPAGQAVLHEREDREVYAAHRQLRVEKWLHRPEGRRLVETVLTPLLSADSEMLGLLGIGRDITDRQRAEEQVRQTAKMEAIGRLAGGIAHDFNNLLTVILGNLELAQSSPGSDPAARDALADCEKAAARAAELTNQLLGFARRTPLAPETLDLNRQAEDMAGLLRRAMGPRIALETRLGGGLWAVEADPAQLGQVLMNLCLNARDAMPDGGRLILETANVTLDEPAARLRLDARPGEFVRLRVSDTGQGIAPEVRARIFEPFFTTKPFGQGTGLGLAMVFGIAQQHRGWVECHSEPDRGTRFDVYLPRSHGTCAAPAGQPEVPATGRETILIVDDEPMIRDMGRAALQQFGYQVLLAEDGVVALDLYRSRGRQIDLVLLDLTMPHLSGHEVLRELRRLDPSVRVVFASGYSADHLSSDEAQAIRGFVQKPYRPLELARAVREALNAD